MAKGGHLSHCKACMAKKSAAYRKENLEKVRDIERKSKAKTYNSELQTKRKREEYLVDPTKFNLRSKRYYRKNVQARKASVKAYRKNNPDKLAHFRALRRSAQLKATPPWLNNEHRRHIACLYQMSRKISSITGEAMEVDHIIPLKGSNICGLHVPWNLQILHHTLNRAKSNKVEEDF